MPLLSQKAVREQIASGELGPLYLVVGADEVLKAEIASAFAEAIEPDLRAFNVERLYGGDLRAPAFVDAARTLPMMAARRVLLILQAEKLFVPKRESAASASDLEQVEDYVRSPEPLTTVVFVAGALDKRRKLTTLLYKLAAVVDCSGVADRGEAEAWIRAAVAREGTTIERDAVRLLAERGGTDIRRLRAEVERVCLYVNAGAPVTVTDVKAVIGAETLQDEWGVVRQLEQGSAAGALRELALVFATGGVPFMILGQLRSYVERSLPRDRMRPAVEALFRTDLALKSSAGDPRVLLERLVVELAESAGSYGPRRR